MKSKQENKTSLNSEQKKPISSPLESASKQDPAHDILRYQPHPLDAVFSPKNVAVIGATERIGSVGRTILWNLISTPFGGTVFPVNPNRKSVMGIKSYTNISSIPDPIDLAIVVTPAPTVPDIIGECIDSKVKSAIVISAGFKECGPQGIQLEGKILQHLKRGKMPLIGPNCLGIMNPIKGLNATFARASANPGSIAFVSQSGALCTSILDWSIKENFGFSAFISLGSMLNVGWGDMIDYLGNDPHTRSIIIYMESIGDARSFLSAAREVALNKPIIILKAGHTEAAAKAAASHTGAMTGSDEALEAAFKRSGVLRVNTISDLFYMSEVLAKQPRPKGPKLAIVTNAGGAGVLATDALIAGGGELAPLAPKTIEALNKVLPLEWSHNNPIDILGDASPQRFTQALEIVAQESSCDGFLVILTPQAMTLPTQTAEQLALQAHHLNKPILTSWMGGMDVAAGQALLNRSHIPTFPYPDTAVRIFNYMWKYEKNLNSLYETPSLPLSDEEKTNHIICQKIICSAQQENRTLLTETESKEILSAYGIPTVKTVVAKTEEEALETSKKLGYPVVLKLYSHTITHKTDVGGVKLNLGNALEVKKAYQEIQTSITQKQGAKHFQGVTVQPMIKREGLEIILGSSPDPQLGPVILFGAGGQLVEIFKDHALALPPLNTTLARRLMEHTRIYSALKGVRGSKSVDLSYLEKILVQFSQLILEQKWIKEIDINPLIASSEKIIAVDARIVLYESQTKLDEISKPAIRPYPSQYVNTWKTKKGLSVTIRPIRPEDEPLMILFHQTLSEQSVYMRFFETLGLDQRIAHERLMRRCFIDYDREMALVAIHKNIKTQKEEIIGVGRLSKLSHDEEAEFAILITDTYQTQGLGSELLRQLIQIGYKEKIHHIIAELLPSNKAMQHICRKMGFTIQEGDRTLKAILKLSEKTH